MSQQPMKWEDKGIKTPLSRARGLGAAGHGTHHWLMQRISAISNFILVIWFMYAGVSLIGLSHAEAVEFLAQPYHAIMMILLTLSVFYHAALGLQVFIEDYIHSEGFKVIKLIGLKLTLGAMAVTSLFAILKIAFAG